MPSADFRKTLIEFAFTLAFYLVLVGMAFWYLGLNEPLMRLRQCDAERVAQHQAAPFFEQDGSFFSGGAYQSDEQARSGKHSIKLSKGKGEYGFGFYIPYLHGNEKIKLSVWRKAAQGQKATGALVASVEGGLLWKANSKPVEKGENGWEKLELTIDPLLELQGKRLDLYCWNAKATAAYFDDLTIEIRREEKL
ncbi:MAG: hypothetical protein AAFV25_13785 [Bacteroidota bacterium]